MSLDDTIVTPTTTSSFLRWCVLDISGQALICAACDVSWLRETTDCCWVCGHEGQRVRDLKRG